MALTATIYKFDIDLSDADMLDVVRADLATVMGLTARPGFTRIFRHPLGIPQYTVTPQGSSTFTRDASGIPEIGRAHV